MCLTKMIFSHYLSKKYRQFIFPNGPKFQHLRHVFRLRQDNLKFTHAAQLAHKEVTVIYHSANYGFVFGINRVFPAMDTDSMANGVEKHKYRSNT